MLSRSAERIYWLSRYLERTETSARLINVYMNLLMDLPKGVEMGWMQQVRIHGCETQFYAKYQLANEYNVVRFLIADLENPASLFSSLSFAKENIRTTRDLMPDEAWEQVNELYIYAKNNIDSVGNRRNRVVFLNEMQEGCQRFVGLLSGYMSHDHAYRFIRLGRNIERADVSSRVLELACLLLSESRSHEMRQYESLLWINILHTFNALLMYRQHVRSRVTGEGVLNFLLQNKELPRAVAFCVKEMTEAVEQLPNHDRLPQHIIEIQKNIQAIDVDKVDQTQLRRILDDLQGRLAELHEEIAANWFLTPDT